MHLFDDINDKEKNREILCLCTCTQP